MASSPNEEEDIEYDSDPEETKRSLSMRRRREASDDDDEDEDPGVLHSDESDSEGGVADYDDEEEEEEEEHDEVIEEEEGSGANGAVVMVKESDADVKEPLEEAGKKDDNDEEEKKESEPFAVPTAGAFYMHDDRFRDTAATGSRHRRIRCGRRLRESKDNRKWGHDKFEEITLQERHYKEGRRSSRGSYRGRGKTRGIGRGGYAQDNRQGYDDRGGETQVPKGVVRGRGGRGRQRYEPISKSNGSTSQVQNKQSGNSLDRTSNISLGKNLTPVSSSESDPVPAKKQVFASNLNFASPPFYPSGSSNKDVSQAPQRDVHTGSTRRNVHAGVMDEGLLVQQNNTLLRGKNVVDAVSMDKLYIDDSLRPSVGKPLNNIHMQPPGSSEVNVSQSTYPRAAGSGGAIPVQMNYQSASSFNQANKIPPTQLQAIWRTSAPGQTPTPQLGPPKTSVTISSLGSGEIDAASDSRKSKGTLVGKSQGSGRGSLVYGGALGTAGNMGGNQGDQNFPAFLPVMQFGGQHSCGMGVPSAGMAFSGYVGQPQTGMGSSEMALLPLAGAAGALGAAYGSPYLSVGGAYHAQQSGQTSASATSSREKNASNKANNEWKLPQRPEAVSDEFGQRQNKPRRYSEMTFGE